MLLRKIFNISTSLLLVVCLFSSCSVVMAAKKEGTSVEAVQGARTRGQILALGPVVVNSEKLASGELLEVYQFKKEKGSAARAFMHGVLDVGTVGLWEVVGTPVEVCLKDDKSYAIRVLYDAHDNVIRMELL